MKDMAYVDSHPKRGAFLAGSLHRLADMIVEQGDDLLIGAGLSLPSRAASTVMIVGERGQISAADIAMEFKQPHQLVTQRIEALIELRLVHRLDDPFDRRRKTLALTRKGKKELRLLETCLQEAEQVFLGLYQEIECDLIAVTQRAMKALASRSILDRIALSK